MQAVVVIGARGMLGYAVASYFEQMNIPVFSLSRSEFDIAREPVDKLKTLLPEGALIINCAGIIKPLVKDYSVENVLKVNGLFPRNLALFCRKFGHRCIHITTDCAYSGRQGQYTEDDYFDAEDVYGLSKITGDTVEAMCLRTSIVGEEKNNSRSLLEWAKGQVGGEVNGFTNHFWNGLTTTYLAEIIYNILDQDLYQPGIFHVHSPDSVTKFQLLNIFNEVYGLKLLVKPTEASEFVDRRLASRFGLSESLVVKDIQLQIVEMKDFFLNKSKK